MAALQFFRMLANPKFCNPEQREGSRFFAWPGKTQIPRRFARRNEKGWGLPGLAIFLCKTRQLAEEAERRNS